MLKYSRDKSLALLKLSLAAGAVALPPQAALAEFVPGRLYVTYASMEPCRDPDQIYEFDPLTGESRRVELIPCRGTRSIASKPDGSGMLALSFYHSRVYELDGHGKETVLLGPQDGLLGPGSLAFTPQGDLFVANLGSPYLMKFPGGHAPGFTFAGSESGVTTYGPIAAAPDGDIYYAMVGGSNLLRFAPDGTLSGSVPLSGSITTIVVDRRENVFVTTLAGVTRYEGGDLSVGVQLTDVGYPLTLGADGRSLIGLGPSHGDVVSFDPNTGIATPLGTITTVPFGLWNGGLTVFIPEPAAVSLMLLFPLALRRRA